MRVLSVALALTLASATVAEAEEYVVRRPQVEASIGSRVWISSGRSEFSFGAPGGSPNVLSELKWRDMSSKVVELHGGVVLAETLVFNLVGGFGSLSGGTLRDQDFNGDNRTGLVGDTISTANDQGLYYIQGDIGFRLKSWQSPYSPRRSYVDWIIGFQHWQEKYIATTTTDVFTGTVINAQAQALTETYKWDSIRLGLQTEVALPFGFSIRAKGAYIPWTSYTMEDIHHLRTSGMSALRQDPSFRATASGGHGGQIDATLAYRIVAGLSIEAGYQWWYLKSGTGTIIARPASGPDVPEPFNGATSVRQGVLVGIRYDFGAP
jgi:hypothetical protein